MIDGPRPAREEEYDDLMRLLERSYEKIREFFQDHHPHIWKRENVQLKNRFIIKKDGRIVSHIGLMPLTLIADGKTIEAGGIGGVATDPDFRGSGFMSELLKYTIEAMKERKFPISVLWGDRQRYGSYGWELAGVKLTTVLTRRNLKKLSPVEKVDANRYAGEENILREIVKLHESEPLRVQRDENTHKLLFAKPGQEVWFSRGASGTAYMVTAGGDREKLVIERGGKPEVFLGLASSVLEKTGAENLRIIQSARTTPLTETLLKVCGWYNFDPLANLKILNLDSTLKAFGVKTEGIEFQMTDADENKFESLKISGKELKLPEQAMVRLLFGQTSPDRSFKIEPELAKALDSIFPLDFYVWQLDGV